MLTNEHAAGCWFRKVSSIYGVQCQRVRMPKNSTTILQVNVVSSTGFSPLIDTFSWLKPKQGSRRQLDVVGRLRASSPILRSLFEILRNRSADPGSMLSWHKQSLEV